MGIYPDIDLGVTSPDKIISYEPRPTPQSAKFRWLFNVAVLTPQVCNRDSPHICKLLLSYLNTLDWTTIMIDSGPEVRAKSRRPTQDQHKVQGSFRSVIMAFF